MPAKHYEMAHTSRNGFSRKEKDVAQFPSWSKLLADSSKYTSNFLKCSDYEAINPNCQIRGLIEGDTGSGKTGLLVLLSDRAMKFNELLHWQPWRTSQTVPDLIRRPEITKDDGEIIEGCPWRDRVNDTAIEVTGLGEFQVVGTDEGLWGLNGKNALTK